MCGISYPPVKPHQMSASWINLRRSILSTASTPCDTGWMAAFEEAGGYGGNPKRVGDSMLMWPMMEKALVAAWGRTSE